MADFDQAVPALLALEGGYVDDPDDSGRETYCGISRRYHPSWVGWELIDAHKRFDDFPERLRHIERLAGMVRRFYRERYWDRYRLGELSSQRVAEELFEQRVNLPSQTVFTALQRALLALGYPVTVDGIWGPQTMGQLMEALENGDEQVLRRILNAGQAMQYVRRAEGDPRKRSFLRGWVLRRSA